MVSPMTTPGTPEEMRDLFRTCAELVRERGKDAVPMTSLAVSFGLVWHAFSEAEAAEFFDDLASWYAGTNDSGTVRMPMQRPRRDRRFRSWFS
jgi:hypothetical protein